MKLILFSFIGLLVSNTSLAVPKSCAEQGMSEGVHVAQAPCHADAQTGGSSQPYSVCNNGRVTFGIQSCNGLTQNNGPVVDLKAVPGRRAKLGK